MGIRDTLLSWFSSYLDSRSRLIKFNNSVSKTIKVLSGVSQGGHLFPLLFILSINDLSKCFKTCKFLLFADDMKIFMLSHLSNDTTSLIYDLDQFSIWYSLNAMSLNTTKCVCISFSSCVSRIDCEYFIVGASLKFVSQVRYLYVLSCQSIYHLMPLLIQCMVKLYVLWGSSNEPALSLMMLYVYK